MSNKSLKSRLPRYCEWCHYDAYQEPLSTHRIQAGRDGGKYTLENVVRLCLICHRLADLDILPAASLFLIAERRNAWRA